jgi:DHA2 family multidrug resistance protein
VTSVPSPEGPVAVTTWIGFSAMCLGMFMAILDIQVVVTSLPNIQAALAIPADQMSWIQTAYLIAEVIAIPLTGLMTAIFTMRGLFAGAIATFTLASIGCALAGGFSALIAWRTLQGFAGGFLIPSVFTAVFRLFGFKQQGVATTIAGVLAVLAPTVGPFVGGYITQTFSWHWLFLVNIVPGLVSFALVVACLAREVPDWTRLRQLDGPGLALLALCLALLEIGLKRAPNEGWLAPASLAVFSVSLVSGILFARRMLTAGRPIIELRALADRDFALGSILSFTLGVGLFGQVYLMPVFLAFVRKHDALEIGTVMLATGAAQLASAPIAVALERRLDSRLLTACGFALFALGLYLSSDATRESDAAAMLLPQVLRGVAIMFCLLPPTRLALGHFSQATVADASGLFNLMRNLGGAIGLALVDTIIYGRLDGHANRIIGGLIEGDPKAAALIGLPAGLDTKALADSIDEQTEAVVRPLIEQAALTASINEAWLFLACVALAGLAVVPFVSKRPKHAVSGH